MVDLFINSLTTTERHITFPDVETANEILNSGLKVRRDPGMERRVRFHKSSRKEVVAFLKGIGIKVR